MNRRRFLKYAGATAAVVGASALGLDYLLEPKRTTNASTTISSITGSTSTTTSASNQLADVLIQPFHDYHFDTRQQSDEPTLKDLTLQLTTRETGFTQIVQADSDGKYWARNVPFGDVFTYEIQLVKQQKDGTYAKDDRFPWIALPPEDLPRFGYGDFLKLDDFTFQVKSKETTLPLPLGAGPETLPIQVGTNFEWFLYLDWDPSPETYLWWDGQRGLMSHIDYRIAEFNEIANIYRMKLGTPIVSKLAGTVNIANIPSSGPSYIYLHHRYGLYSTYIHVSESLVKTGDIIPRSQVIAYSGSEGTFMPVLDSSLRTSSTGQFIDVALSEFHPTFPVTNSFYWRVNPDATKTVIPVPLEKNPAIPNYWTVYNEPQFPLST